MNRKPCPKVALAAIFILCITFLMNLHRLRFDDLSLAKITTDGIVLLHPVLIGIILYRWWRWKKKEQD